MAYGKAGAWQQMFFKRGFEDHKLVSHSKIRETRTILVWLPRPCQLQTHLIQSRGHGLTRAAKTGTVMPVPLKV